MGSLDRLILAAALAGGVSLLGGILRMLSFSGAMAAFVIGFFVFGFGGLPFAIPLLAFFFSSSLLSFIGRRRKEGADAATEKPGPRDVWQVVANGAIPALLAVTFALTPDTRHVTLLYLASLAAVNADTWATEVGSMVSRSPRLVTTLRPAPPGTSGAVSLAGLGAALTGGVFIPLTAWLAWPARDVNLLWRIDAAEIVAVGWAGFMAAYVDSLLGATLQAQFRCPRCGVTTERAAHCGARCARIRGLAFVRNDLVNLLASGSGVLFAWMLLRYFAYPIR